MSAPSRTSLNSAEEKSQEGGQRSQLGRREEPKWGEGFRTSFQQVSAAWGALQYTKNRF